MHLRVRLLLVLIELFLLIVAEDLAHLFVGLIKMGPRLVQTLFARRAFVLQEFPRGVMQCLEDGFHSGLLIAGKVEFAGQHFQLLFDGR